MHYLYTKFGDFGLSHFDFIVRTDTHTDRITDANDLYTDFSNDCTMANSMLMMLL